MKKFIAVLSCFCIGPFPAFCQPDLFVPFRKGKGWGFADQERNIRITPRFERVTPFSTISPDGYATAVPVASAWSGDSCWLFGVNGDYRSFVAGKNGSLNRMNKSLWVFKCDDGEYLLDSLLRVVTYVQDVRLPVRMPEFPQKALFLEDYGANGTGGQPHPDGPFLRGTLPLDVNWWNRAESGVAFAVEDKKSHLTGLMDARGNMLLKPRYRFISNVYDNAVATDSGIVHLDGPAKYLPEMELTPKISETGLIRFRTTDLQKRRTGFCNMAGEIVIPPQFLEAYGFYKGFAYCQDTLNQWLLIDTSGKILFAGSAFEDVRWNPDYLFIRGQDGKWRAYDWKLQLRSTMASDRIWEAALFAGIPGYAGYENQKVFLYDPHFNLLLKPEYDEVTCVRNGARNDATPGYLSTRFLAKTGNAYRLLDRNFMPASAWFYRNGMNVVFFEGLQYVSVDGKWQEMDTTGRFTNSVAYDTATYPYPKPSYRDYYSPDTTYYFENHYYREKGTPLSGVYKNWKRYARQQTLPGYWLTMFPEEPLDIDSDVITIQSEPNSYFRDDGQCLLAGFAGQVITFDRKDHCLIVSRADWEKNAVFDLYGKAVTDFNYTQIWIDPALPIGFVRVQVGGKSWDSNSGSHRILRVRDGVEFFEK